MPESRRKQEDNIDQIIKAVKRELQGPVNKTIDNLLHPHFYKYPFLRDRLVIGPASLNTI